MFRLSSKCRHVPEVDLITFYQRFPDLPLEGYRKFLREFGEGTYCDFMDIFSPNDCLIWTETNRQVFRENDFWDDEPDGLSQVERAESVTLGMSIDGDALVAHPKRHDRLFILPRHDEPVFWTPATLNEPMRWISSHGDKLTTPDFEFFTPHVDRSYVEFSIHGTASNFAALTDLAVRDYRVASDPMLEQRETLQVGLLSKVAGRYQSHLSGQRIHLRLDYDSDFAALLSLLSDRLSAHEFHFHGRSDQSDAWRP